MNADLMMAAMNALEMGDVELASSYLAETVVFEGSTRQPLSKSELIALQIALCAAMPDFSFNLEHLREDGDRVWAAVRISGTHNQDLDLSVLGLPTIPCTGIYCQLPQEHIECTIQNGQIMRIQVHSAQGGGITGLLEQLGVDLPL